MKVHEMKEMAVADLAGHINDTRKEIVELRFQLAARKLESPAKLRMARRRLARLLTIQGEKNNPNYKPTPKKAKTGK